MVRSYYQQDDEPGGPARHGNPGEDAEKPGTEPEAAGEHGRHRHSRADADTARQEIDHFECAGVGANAASQYVTDHHEDMERRKDQLSTLPAEYAAAREAALGIRDSVVDDIAAVRTALECHLAEAIRTRFQHAWTRVHRRLDRCAGSPKLCPGPHDCDFPFSADEDTRTLLVHQVHYTDRAELAEQQFDALAGEPADLQQRGTDLGDEVSDLKELAAKEPPAYEAAYAALLAAEYHATTDVILGGIDTANDYEDYLLSCFDCSYKGRNALMRIAGILAARGCRAERRHARCEELRGRIAAEIIAEAHDLEREERNHQPR